MLWLGPVLSICDVKFNEFLITDEKHHDSFCDHPVNWILHIETTAKTFICSNCDRNLHTMIIFNLIYVFLLLFFFAFCWLGVYGIRTFRKVTLHRSIPCLCVCFFSIFCCYYSVSFALAPDIAFAVVYCRSRYPNRFLYCDFLFC